MTGKATIAITANTLGNTAGAGAIGGGGILVIMGQNAPAIGAICVIIVSIASVVLKTIGYIELKRHHREMEKPNETP